MVLNRSKREILADSPLFKNLLNAELTMLADLFSIREFKSGDLVFSQGDIGDSLYVIAEGRIDENGCSRQERVFD